MKSKTIKLDIKFDQQQLQLLDNLKKESKFGKTYAEIVVNVLRKYIRQTSDNKGGM